MAEVIACQVVVLDGSIVSIDANVSLIAELERNKVLGGGGREGHTLNLLASGLAAKVAWKGASAFILF